MTADVRRRDPEEDFACADCGREAARLRSVTREGRGVLVCDPACWSDDDPRNIPELP